MTLLKPLLFVLMMLTMTACQNTTTETDRHVDAVFIALDDASIIDTGSVTVAREYVFDVNQNGLVDEDDLYPMVLAASSKHGSINALTTLEAAGFTPGELFGLLAVYRADTGIDGSDVSQMTAHVNAILVINALSATSEARGVDRFEMLRNGVTKARATIANGIATNWQSAISSVSGGLTLISPDRVETFEALVEEVKGHVGGGVHMADRLKRPDITIDANGTVTIEVSPDYPIYYTTDGSDPDINATRYEAAFIVESGTTVKAIVIYKQMSSRVESGTYSLSPVNCHGDFAEEYGLCSAECGGGERNVSLVYRVQIDAANGGMDCAYEEGYSKLLTPQSCNEQGCGVDCEGAFAPGEWGSCSAECGGGERSRVNVYAVTQSAVNDGEACPFAHGFEQTETEPCNTEACAIGDCVGAFTVQSDWGACSQSCGGGTQERTLRYVIETPADGGEACVHADGALQVETRDCNTQGCPVDCVGGYDDPDWSVCSESCGGGEQSRTLTYHVATEAANGGQACPNAEGDTKKETQACNTQGCAQDCLGSFAYGTWSSCSADCGGGEQERTKTFVVTQSAANGGQACDYAHGYQETETQACNLTACAANDCVGGYTAITGWSTCSAECGGGTQTRTLEYVITEPATNGGAECPHEEGYTKSQSQDCNTQGCPVDCVGAFNNPAWGTCSAECGGGTQSRTLTYNITTTAANGGDACPYADGATQLQTQSCNTQGCPVDCIGSFNNPAWGTCSAECGGGTQSRTLTYSITTAAANGGDTCPHTQGFQTEQQQACNTQACPSEDCVGSFVAQDSWSTCSKTCGGGTQTRTLEYVVTSAAVNGGAECPYVDGYTKTDSQSCNTQACPVDCVGSFNNPAWGTCSAECGGGTQSRTLTYSITTAAANGGDTCPYSHGYQLPQEQACNTQTCPVGDCVGSFVAQDDWSTCSEECGGGTQSRTIEYVISSPATYGGEECAYDDGYTTREYQACNTQACPVDCIGSFDNPAWGTCSAECGGGTQSRTLTYSITTAAANGGDTCPYSHGYQTDEQQACNTQSCPVDCEGSFGSWSSWSTCSAECGGGTQTRSRTYSITQAAQDGGAECPYTHGYVETDSQSCNAFACAVDCVGSFGSWSSWSECSEFCGGGEQSRSRTYTITQPAQNGGTDCPYANGYEDTDTQACNTGGCPTSTLPKTGQTVSYADYDDGWYQTGVARNYSRSNDIVTDHVTGLQWQDDAEAASIKRDWSGAQSYCEAKSLGGYADWHLPSIEELVFSADRGRYNPAIDPVFQNVASSYYWSSTTYASDTSYAWNVNFYHGTDGWDTKTDTYYVRCVRGGQLNTLTFIRNDEREVVFDATNGLEWQDTVSVMMTKRTWQEAIDYCHALNFAGKQDWRLPNFLELTMIADRSQYNPAIDPAFQSVATSNYWSSTTNASDTSYAWGVYFTYGSDYWGAKTNAYYVRCVRGGQ